MRLERSGRSDVLVLGGGLAGIVAAVEAARGGARVALACEGPLFGSGSSFYPGTWGMGLIAPDGPGDEADLERTILEVGSGAADPALVHELVHGIAPAVARLQSRGVRLRRPDSAGEREYIPCFDHKHRAWYGVEAPSLAEVFGRSFQELGVELLPRHAVLALVRPGDSVCGAVLLGPDGPVYRAARSTVLATGGFAGLFERHVCPAGVAGVGQGLALAAGARLVNMEFMQMMPAYVAPGAAYGTVFNEKTFRWARLALPEAAALGPLLGQRSGYGPFTSRLASRDVDIAVWRAFVADGRGVPLSYDPELLRHMPEFVRTYFEWLRAAKGLGPGDAARIGIFAHAANGGVAIDARAWTGVDGLYAAGEVTGGMHGADRLGGLSSANCLVFGGRAGASAAEAALGAPEPDAACELPDEPREAGADALSRLRRALFRHAMVVRTGEGLAEALATVADLEVSAAPGEYRLRAQLACARAVLEAALARRSSLGPHYRADEA